VHKVQLVLMVSLALKVRLVLMVSLAPKVQLVQLVRRVLTV
jgi:hypothetical protein